MNDKLDILFTDSYRVLKLFYDTQTTIDGISFSPITQLEIADKLNISKMTVSTIIKQLKEAEFISIYNNNRGRYCLSEKIIELINNVNKTFL